MSEARPHNQINVLLVDEQRTVALAIGRMLEGEADIELHVCADERTAEETIADIRPHVILQDINLPHINGFEMLRRYNDKPDIRDIPVIMLSGEDNAETKARAFLAGADDYMVKPPHPVELIARIRHHARAYEEHREREQLLIELQQERERLKKANRQLEMLSTTDGLTQIPNRRCFDRQLLHEWRLSVRNRTPFSLALIDVDNFKNFNDYYGHQAGDACLQQVAAALRESVHRPADVVARYGGEEFGVILPDTSAEGATKIVEAMRVAVEALKIPHAKAQAADCVTISIGMCSALPGEKEEQTPDELLHLADAALYKAKENGPNQVIVADA